MAWKEALRTAIKSHKELDFFFAQSFAETKYPVFIPKRIAEKIKAQGLNGPLAKQFLPHENENKSAGFVDPIGDQVHKVGSRGVHRYKNRSLFFPTPHCPIDCRYCFRKNELIPSERAALFDGRYEEYFSYLKAHPEIEEVIFSGGDPFILDDQKIYDCLEQIAQIKSVKHVRFHTRTPVILPERITPALCEILDLFLQKFTTITIVLHLNHNDEIDTDFAAAISMLQKTKAQLLSQSVLLNGVNDDLPTLVNLFKALINLKIRPYYLHHPDRAQGTEHFWIDLEKGRQLYHQLRQEIPGWAMPQYVIDVQGGEGKLPAFNPEGFEFKGKLLNSKGHLIDI